MRFRFVDRYGWERWQKIDGLPPAIMNVADERALQVPRRFADDPMQMRYVPLVFHRQSWRDRDFREDIYVEDGDQVTDVARFNMPSVYREDRLRMVVGEAIKIIEGELGKPADNALIEAIRGMDMRHEMTRLVRILKRATLNESAAHEPTPQSSVGEDK